ncbi:AraC family transcriptional regulator [Paramixta manurensis]|uniref:AraC family transcriptional regulator n=1 Tax=Paramixta manurensis TaxID=2740817 RepID=A0A6M8URS9_9GAMM|nr:AraC family transcriptional regulator [Erwiniaceae bacterium PD-1]
MLDNSSKNPRDEHSDPLTNMLQGLRLDGVEYGRFNLGGEWAFSFAPAREACFIFVAEKGCWLQTPDGEWQPLSAGDAVLLPQGSAHALASHPEASPLPFPRWQCMSLSGNVFDFSATANQENCRLFYGTMRFNIDGQHPLLRMMPALMRANELMKYEPAIIHLLEAMSSEVALNRAGACGIIARLADVLAAQIIRAWVEHGCGDATGWIAAVRNPEMGRVLAAIHAQPHHDWTLAELSALMGASRSSFASKFAAIVGETPARYVAQVRMHLARRWIVEDAERISEVAQRLGYDSEASFSRAFKRVIGMAPSHFRARSRAEITSSLR